MHKRIILKNSFKIYIKINIKTALTCILIGYFNNCDFIKHE